MTLVDILVFYEHISVFVKDIWEAGKEWIRQQLGPSTSISYLLLENDTVIPATMVHCKYVHAASYIQNTKRITNGTDAPYKRLPWLSVQHIIGDHIVDISEWMSELRSNTPIRLLALLRLASYTHSLHLPETPHAFVRVITRDGEEKEYKYTGGTVLSSCELHRKQTCPFDMDGIPYF